MIGSASGLVITGSGDSTTVAAAAAVANAGIGPAGTDLPDLPTGRTLFRSEGSEAFSWRDTCRGPPTSRVFASPLGRPARLPLPFPFPLPFPNRGPVAG